MVQAHYAMAAKRRLCNAKRFDIIRVSDLTDDLIPLTDPETAICWCAVLEIETGLKVDAVQVDIRDTEIQRVTSAGFSVGGETESSSVLTRLSGRKRSTERK
jgi:hypothetical protein